MEKAKAWYWLAELEFLKKSGEAIGEGEASVTVGPLHAGDDRMGDVHRAPWLYTVLQSWPASEKQCVLWMAERQKRDCPSLWSSEDHDELPMSHTELQDLNFTPELGFCYDLIVIVL